MNVHFQQLYNKLYYKRNFVNKTLKRCIIFNRYVVKRSAVVYKWSASVEKLQAQFKGKKNKRNSVHKFYPSNDELENLKKFSLTECTQLSLSFLIHEENLNLVKFQF